MQILEPAMYNPEQALAASAPRSFPHIFGAMSSWKDLLFIDKFRRGLNRRGISRDLSAVLSKSNHLSIVVAFRCWTAGWLLAAFLSFILVFIKPPAEATIVFLAQSLLGSVVLAITWACHLARDHQRDQRIASAAQGSILKQNPNATQAEIDGQLLVTIFEGAFLQPAPSAIWGVFLFIGIYGVFLIRAYQVRLFFVMVFSTIILSIFATIAPLIPVFYAHFRSQKHSSKLNGVFPSHCTPSFAALSVSSMAELSPSDVTAALATHEAQRGAVIALFDSAGMISPYLGMEISVGNASGVDVKELGILMRDVTLTIGGFSNFLRHMKHRRSLPSVADPSKTENEITIDPLQELLLSLARVTEKKRVLTELRDALAELEKTRSEDDQTILVITALAQRNPTTESEGTKGASTQGTTTPLPFQGLDSDSSDDDVLQFLHAIYLESLDVLGDRVLDLLRFAIKVEEQSIRLWFPGKQNSGIMPTKSAMSLGSLPPKEEGGVRPLNASGISAPQDIDLHTNAEKYSDPTGPRFHGTDPVPDGEDDPSIVGNTMTAPPDIEAGEGHPLPSKGVFFVLHRVIHFATNTQSSFAFKIGLLAIALACPAWIRANKSAKFYFDNKGATLCTLVVRARSDTDLLKGVWALILGLTAKGVYSSETTYGFIQRVIGAVIGGVVGLAMWYSSIGSGNRNAYGLAIICGVVLCYAMPYRIWHHNDRGIGSRINGTLVPRTAPIVSNPGVGYAVFWRRLFLVLIAVTAAWLIDLVPKPKTGREALRITYSKTTSAIGSVTATVLARIKEAPIQPQSKGSLIDYIGPQMMSIHNKIRMSSVRIALAKLEPSIDRPWSEAQYVTLQRLQFEMLDWLGILAIVSRDLDMESRSRLLASPLFQNDQLTSLLNLFYVASSSLQSEQPLPSQIPAPRHVIAMSGDLDRRLSLMAGNNLTTQFVLFGGAYVELCKCAEQLVKECQLIFGTSMLHPF
ncbi:hypothetical protein BS47DRAFT_1362373 [Hydnum rufescens UP504]|uniref:ER transporter 6TM N-terminal domain-containing protein n=1 Tax=Hydnum rufescens UP504 TaxID=1448309 RepID=A0A9P6AWW6_9AGAM|nr:hypothetical protein BS47DRAFT_1362373 [Hydnum rufescens UP504]